MINYKKFLTKKTILIFLVLVIILYLGRRCMGIIEGIANVEGIASVVDNTGGLGKDESSVMKKPGCWYKFPSGCPNAAWNPGTGWVHDIDGEKYRNAKVNQLDCEETRKNDYNRMCGVTDVIPQWNQQQPYPPPEPTEPGCNVKLPSGCKNGWTSTVGAKDGFLAKTWMNYKTTDSYTKENYNIWPSNASQYDKSKNECEEILKTEINTKCNIGDTITQFIPEPPPPPCDNWKKCSDEGGVCEFNGTQDIIYSKPISHGAQPNPNASLVLKNQTSTFQCNNDNAGGDPAYGTVKACYYCPPKVSIACSGCRGSAALSEKYNTGCPNGERPWDMCTDSTGTYWGAGWGDAQNIYNNVYNPGSSLRRSLASAGNCTSYSRYNPATSIGKGCSWYGAAKDQRPSTWYPIKEIGGYRDTGNRALRMEMGERDQDKTSCSEACKDYDYFALQYYDSNTGKSQCFCEDDLTHATKYGTKTCVGGPDGKGKGGSDWCNYIFTNNKKR